jgi:DNA-binding transcriptional regulator YiaG
MMDSFFSNRAGNNLHRSGAAVAPNAGADSGHSACGRPGKVTHSMRKGALCAQGLAEAPGGVQHHFHDALHMPVGRFQRDDTHAGTAGYRGPDLVSVQLLTLALTALKDIGCQGLNNGFLPKIESEGLHLTDSLPWRSRTNVQVPLLQVPEVDVRKVRTKMGLSQSEFLQQSSDCRRQRYATGRQGRSRPDAPTRVLLAVIAKHPEAVEDVLRRAS